MMKFGYTIIYVADVAATINFYVSAFGFTKRFIHESGQYGELETGATTLSFAAHDIAASNLPDGYQPVSAAGLPFGIEIGFVTNNVPAAVHTAVAAGALLISEPKTKPWGQVVAYVRTPEGTLIELCTPAGG